MNTEEAAKRLGMNRQSLRLWMRNGSCPFGTAYKGTGNSFIYYINDSRLEKYLNGEDMKKAPTV